MKAWAASDRNGNEGVTLIVFAETAGKAKAYAAHHETFCDYYTFSEMRVNRRPQLDKYYDGRPEMDWNDDKDRVIMVREADFTCSDDWDCEGKSCPAYEWCGRGKEAEEDGDGDV